MIMSESPKEITSWSDRCHPSIISYLMHHVCICIYIYIYIYMHSYIDIYQISSLIGVTCTPSFVRDLSSLLVSARTPHVSLDLVYARTPSLVRDLSSNLLYARTSNISPDLVYARTPSFVRGLSSLLEYARTPKHDTTQHIILECFSLFLFQQYASRFHFLAESSQIWHQRCSGAGHCDLDWTRKIK